MSGISSNVAVEAAMWLIVCVCVCVHDREQKQKETTTKTTVVNSFPKDRDYRREAMQASTASGFSAASESFFFFLLFALQV